jgi:hypothetical protein
MKEGKAGGHGTGRGGEEGLEEERGGKGGGRRREAGK